MTAPKRPTPAQVDCLRWLSLPHPERGPRPPIEVIVACRAAGWITPVPQTRVLTPAGRAILDAIDKAGAK